MTPSQQIKEILAVIKGRMLAGDTGNFQWTELREFEVSLEHLQRQGLPETEVMNRVASLVRAKLDLAVARNPDCLVRCSLVGALEDAYRELWVAQDARRVD
jgi:hypothetical protein